MLVTTSLMLILSAAPTGDPLVVLTRRSGLPPARAMEVVRAVADALTRSGLKPAGPEDASSCGAKKACLVDLGRKRKVNAMVLVEVGMVLDDAVGRAESISIEEDGRRLDVVDFEGSAERLAAGLATKAEGQLATGLKALLGVAASSTPDVPPVTPPPPPPRADAKPPPPPPPSGWQSSRPPTTVTVTKPVEPAERPFLTPVRTVGLVVGGVGVAGLITGGVFGILAIQGAGQVNTLCNNTRQPCTNPEAFPAYQAAGTNQTIGIIAAAAGGGLTALGAILLAVGGGGGEEEARPADASLSIAPAPGGGGLVTVQGRF